MTQQGVMTQPGWGGGDDSRGVIKHQVMTPHGDDDTAGGR